MYNNLLDDISLLYVNTSCIQNKLVKVVSMYVTLQFKWSAYKG